MEGDKKKRECVAHLQLPAIHRHELHLKVKGGAAWDDAACTAGTIAVLAGDHAAEKVWRGEEREKPSEAHTHN